jgi:hypothetical protein
MNVLYYSNQCNNCKNVLSNISKWPSSQQIHFICIDSRVNENGKIFIVLENGKKMLMPENMRQVPALLFLQSGQMLFGVENILNALKPKQQQEVAQATLNNMEPQEFSFEPSGGGGSHFGIVSDQYSFLDMNETDLSAQGDGGLRQLHNYMTIHDEVAYSTLQQPQQPQQRNQQQNQKNAYNPNQY